MRISIKSLPLKARGAGCERPAFRGSGVHIGHDGAHVRVAQQLRNGPDIIPIFQEVGGERLHHLKERNPRKQRGELDEPPFSTPA